MLNMRMKLVQFTYLWKEGKQSEVYHETKGGKDVEQRVENTRS